MPRPFSTAQQQHSGNGAADNAASAVHPSLLDGWLSPFFSLLLAVARPEYAGIDARVTAEMTARWLRGAGLGRGTRSLELRLTQRKMQMIQSGR